jgi:hypothetical protein
MGGGFGRGLAELWFAFHDDERVAGGLVLYGSEELFFWSASTRPEFGSLRPSNALNVALIRAASDRGLRWYNLGSSEGLPGVKRFKRSLGASTHVYRTYELESKRYAAFHRIRRTLRGVAAPRAGYLNATAAVSGDKSAGGGKLDTVAEPPSSAPDPLSSRVRR